MKTTIISVVAAAAALAAAVTTEEVRIHRADARIETLVAERTAYRILCSSIRYTARTASERLDTSAVAQLDVIGNFAGLCGADREGANRAAERTGRCAAIDHDWACARQAATELVDMMPEDYPEFDPAFDH